MDAHIIFANIPINYITDSFSVDKTRTHRTSPYVGSRGSNTSYVSTTGRVISFKSLCLRDETGTGNIPRIQEYIALSETYDEKEAVLTSKSESQINGNYILTDFKYSEDTTGNFTIDWEFTEQVPFNVTEKTFRVWNKSKVKGTSNSKSKGLDANTKKLLKDCPTLHKGAAGSCAKALQTFLQSQGYYTKHKVDGLYFESTANAVKSLQKKHKLKVTGNWDESTRLYFQIKFKYPTTLGTELLIDSKGFSTKKKKKSKR